MPISVSALPGLAGEDLRSLPPGVRQDVSPASQTTTQPPQVPFLAQPAAPQAQQTPQPISSIGRLLFPVLGALAGQLMGGKFGAVTGFAAGSGFLQGQKAERDRLAELERQGLREKEEDYQKRLQVALQTGNLEGAAALEDERGNTESAAALRERAALKKAETTRTTKLENIALIRGAVSDFIKTGARSKTGIPEVDAEVDSALADPLVVKARGLTDAQEREQFADTVASRKEHELRQKVALMDLEEGKKPKPDTYIPGTLQPDGSYMVQTKDGPQPRNDPGMKDPSWLLKVALDTWPAAKDREESLTWDTHLSRVQQGYTKYLETSPQGAELSDKERTAMTAFAAERVNKTEAQLEADILASPNADKTHATFIRSEWKKLQGQKAHGGEQARQQGAGQSDMRTKGTQWEKEHVTVP